MNFITKMILLIAMLTLPVLGLYLYSNHQSVTVVKEQINLAGENRLKQFLDEIEGTMEQVSSYSSVIMKDPDFAEFAGGARIANRYDYAELQEAVERKLTLFSLSTRWMNRINLYFPVSGLAASSHGNLAYDEVEAAGRLSPQWRLRPIMINGTEKRAFTRHFADPMSGLQDIRKASIVVEIDLIEDNIVQILDRFKSQGNNDPFLITASGEYVLNATADERTTRRIAEASHLADGTAVKQRETVRLDDKEYLLYSLYSPDLDMTLVDYVPLEAILAPVTRAQQWFYATFAALLLLGITAALILYFNVQIPIRLLTRSADRLSAGNFSERIDARTNREFKGLVAQFNRMAEQIQHFVGKSYLEEIRAKEAVMKQLQSQINPHFLYNSIAYIISMVNMNRPAQAVKMGHALADYFRYTTRNVAMVTTLREEIAFVTTYLDIMNDQLDKIGFSVSVPEPMLGMQIPRLLLQPLAENAVLHGLEDKLGPGHIRIVGIEESGACSLSVEDDGIGMAPADMDKLNRSLRLSEPAEDHFGLWNVYQRLQYQFGEGSEMYAEPSETGGVRVVMRWRGQIRMESGETG